MILYETVDLATLKKVELKSTVDSMKKKPRVLIIQVGEVEASTRYVNHKIKDCGEVGIVPLLHKFDENITQEAIIDLIDSANKDDSISAIFCQLPLPPHIDENAIIESISPSKDCDGFHPINVGKLSIGLQGVVSATPLGITYILDDLGLNDLSGKNCVIIGRSNIVSKPMAQLLLKRNGTITICHSRTSNLEHYTKNADLIVVAVGREKFLNSKMVKDGATIIDVGINFDNNGKLCGDCDKESFIGTNCTLTNVPRGCGITTRLALLDNIIKLANKGEM